jgi:hypothetical protein
MDEIENETAKNNDVVHKPQFNDNHFISLSPPVLQQSQSIATDHPSRNIAHRKHLIEDCNIVNYAMSCTKQVENDSKPATYTEAIASVNREK